MNAEPETRPSNNPSSGPRSTLRVIFFNPRELRAGWRFLIYIVVGFGLLLGLQFLAKWFHLPRRSIHVTGMLTQEALACAAAFGAAALLGFFEHRTIGDYGLPARQAFRGKFWRGVVWGFVMISVVMLLIRAFGGYSFGKIDLSRGAILGYAVLWGLAFLIGGFFEEFLFRGYTQFTLATGIGFWPAAILLSAGFASVHLFNPGEGPVGALSVFTFAIFFCLTLRRTGSLWFAVGLHAAWDWCETFLFSVPNSGLVVRGHLSNSSLHGASWLTGGTVGPEGSVMTFAVMGAAFVVFALVYRKPAEPSAPAPATPPLAA